MWSTKGGIDDGTGQKFRREEAEAAQEEEYTADAIQVLKGLEGVRKRPAMYIGDTSENGLHELVKEIVNNSIDEAMAGRCSRIDVTITTQGTARVQDDGRGIPTDFHVAENKSGVEVVMTMLHAGGKFDKKAYQVSGGLHGVGASVVNALSEWCTVEVWQKGKVHLQRYARGVAETGLEVIGDTDQTGTVIEFKPDAEIFEIVEFSFEFIAVRLRELAFLTKGVEINIRDERSGEADCYLYEGGVQEFVALPQRGPKRVTPRSDLSSGRARRSRRRGGPAVQRQLPRNSFYLCEQHKDRRGRNPSRGVPLGVDSDDQQLRDPQ